MNLFLEKTQYVERPVWFCSLSNNDVDRNFLLQLSCLLSKDAIGSRNARLIMVTCSVLYCTEPYRSVETRHTWILNVKIKHEKKLLEAGHAIEFSSLVIPATSHSNITMHKRTTHFIVSWLQQLTLNLTKMYLFVLLISLLLLPVFASYFLAELHAQGPLSSTLHSAFPGIVNI